MCAECGEREAMVFIRRSDSVGEGRDLVLCEECAKSRGIIAGKGILDLNIDDLIGAGLDPSQPRAKPAACPSCGLELSDLMREGRLGCAACSDAFSAELTQALGRKPPFAIDEDLSFLSRASTQSPAATDASALEDELESALASEDYERAALLRDELSRRTTAQPKEGRPAIAPSLAFPSNFPLSADSFTCAKGPDDDIVLWSSAKLYRDIDGIPFPGSPKGSPSPSRPLILERLLSYGSWNSRSMSELGPVARRSLSERGILPRGYAADEGAVLVSAAREGCFVLLDEGDHLRVRSVRPGFDPLSALASSLAQVERIGRDFPFARRPGIGWICSRLADCGLGAALSALVHIPALAAAGMRDRLFRALMADGVALRGFYSTGEESTGSVYEIGVEPAVAPSLRDMVATLTAAVAKVIQAERRARAEITARAHPLLADAEGRAFGIVRHCGLLGSDEAATFVSALRLASLRGTLSGVDPRELGTLLLSLGAGSVAQAEGLRELPEPEAADALRSRLVKAALAGAEYTDRVEEGA
jgi:protein-arginine kinase/protein-arginine kinase activator protein McsA